MAYQRNNFKPGMLLKAEDLCEIEDQLCENDETMAKMRMDINEKQDGLVSGINVKTINGESILGEGNINTGAGGGTGDIDGELSEIIDTYILNINYDGILAFDTSELVIGGSTSPILGTGMLGYMVLA